VGTGTGGAELAGRKAGRARAPEPMLSGGAALLLSAPDMIRKGGRSAYHPYLAVAYHVSAGPKTCVSVSGRIFCLRRLHAALFGMRCLTCAPPSPGPDTASYFTLHYFARGVHQIANVLSDPPPTSRE
jgi:hypothetical protein